VIGLAVAGPARGFVTSIITPGMSRVRSRISSMIWEAGRRWRQSTNSNWIVPIVSSVTSFEPALAFARPRIDGRELLHAEQALLDGADEPVLLVMAMLPRARTCTSPKSGLDIGEELDPVPEPAIGEHDADQHRGREHQRGAGRAIAARTTFMYTPRSAMRSS
jgi:hypothetical protein